LVVGSINAEGQSTGTANTFTASGSDFYFNNWSVTSGTVKGTVVQKSTINATTSQNVAVAMALTPSKQDGFIAIGEKINE
jgi:hypothetical protein